MPKPSPGLESNPGKKAEMVSRKHPYYPEKDTCIWLKLARQGGAKARLKRFFNGEEIECKNQCNGCKVYESVINRTNNTDKMPTIDKKLAEKAISIIEEDFDKQDKGQKGCRVPLTTIGKVEKTIIDFLEGKNMKLETEEISIDAKHISHMFRQSKSDRGADLSVDDLKDFISNMNRYNVAFDKSHNNLIYYKEVEDGIAKFIVEPNFDIKGVCKGNMTVTSGKVIIKESFFTQFNEDIKKAEQ